MIRPVHFSDVNQLTAIYNHYIIHSIATLEEQVINESEMVEMIEVTGDLPFLVIEESEEILGYAYAGKWNSRSGYKHSVATTVYVKDGQSGKGIGSKLYSEILNQLKQREDVKAVMGGISLPNAASVALHEKFGYEQVAHFKKVGYKFGKWIDVGYWQLILD